MAKKPLEGLTFCCTSISIRLREEIAHKVVSLGGIHYGDLMSDVNYLIVGDRKTEKYTYCIRKRYDIKFLNADAVPKIYDYWLNGEEDENLLNINNYLLPVFENLNVCISRMDTIDDIYNTEHRRGFEHSSIDADILSDLIRSHGGKVTDYLTASNSCIITTEGSGKRYSKAIEWNIPVVHPLWVVDSIIRHGAMSFSDYTLNSKHNGCDVWSEIFQYRKKERNRSKKSKKLELASKAVKKDNKIWHEIMNKNSSSGPHISRVSEWDEDVEEEEEEDEEEVEDQNGNFQEKPKGASVIFNGLKFFIVGFTPREKRLLSKVIDSNGGQVLFEVDDSFTHLLVPVKLGAKYVAEIAKENIISNKSYKGCEIVTEWFIERCLFYGKVVYDLWCNPLKGLRPCSRKFRICITGFTGIEMLHIEKLITYIGFEFCPTFTQNRDLLIVNINLFRQQLEKNAPQLYKGTFNDILACPVYQESSYSVSLVSAKNKITAAKRWLIPVVSIAYLWEAMHVSSPDDISELVLPDIDNSLWCLYVPKIIKANTLLEYTVNRTSLLSHSAAESDNVVAPKIHIPSPRKLDRKRKYGRLRGSPSSESLQTKFQKLQEQDDGRLNDTSNIEEDQLTQIRYQDTSSVKNNEELLKKLSKLKERK